MKKKIGLLVGVFFLIGLAIGGYMYVKPNPSVANMKTDVTLTAGDLLAAFETDEAAANAEYLDQVIALSGTISSIATNEDGLLTLTLDTGNPVSGVICEMEADRDHGDLAEGQTISLKGLCTGYLMDVVLVRCVLAD